MNELPHCQRQTATPAGSTTYRERAHTVRQLFGQEERRVGRLVAELAEPLGRRALGSLDGELLFAASFEQDLARLELGLDVREPSANKHLNIPTGTSERASMSEGGTMRTW